MAVAQGGKGDEDLLERGEIGIRVDPEIMRMPPEVIPAPGPGRLPQAALDHAQMGRVEEREAARFRAEELAGGHIAVRRPVNRIAVGAQSAGEAIDQAQPAAQQMLACAWRGAVGPAVGVSPPMGYSMAPTDLEMFRGILVAGEDDRDRADPVPRGDPDGALQVCLEGGEVLPGLKAIIMRQRVGTDFLSGGLGDPADQGETIVIGVVPLVAPDRVEMGIGRQRRVFIARSQLLGGQARAQRVAIFGEEEADGRLGRADPVPLEEVEHARDRSAAAQDVAPVGAAVGVIAHAPE